MRADMRHGGFTLLEVMVALVLLALFSIATYRALDAVLAAERHATEELAQWRRLARVLAGMEADLADAAPGLGVENGVLRGFRHQREASGAVRFSLDRSLPQDASAGLAWVAYRYADGTLVRLQRRPDAPLVEAAAETRLLQGLRRFQVRYLEDSGQWRPDWPEAQGGRLPRAVEIRLETAAGVALRRVFRVQ